MKKLFLTREQALVLGEELIERSNLEDSSLRPLFDGFEIRFGHPHSEKPYAEGEMEVHPIAASVPVYSAEED